MSYENTSKVKSIYIILVVFIVIGIIAVRVFYQPKTSTQSPTPDTTPTPTPSRWHQMMVSGFILEDGKEKFIASSQSNLTGYLLKTLKRINNQTVLLFNKEQVDEIKKNNRAMLLLYRFYEDFSISQWIKPEDRERFTTNETGYRTIEKVKYVLFILENGLDKKLTAHILINTLDEDLWTCWTIRQEEKIDNTWIEEIEKYLLTPVEINLPFYNGTESKLLLIDSHLEYSVFEENITITPKNRFAEAGDPAVVIKGKFRNDYKIDYYFAISCNLYTFQGQKLEGKEYIFSPPIGEFAVTHANDFGTFEIVLKYENNKIEHYELFVALEPQVTPPT